MTTELIKSNELQADWLPIVRQGQPVDCNIIHADYQILGSTARITGRFAIMETGQKDEDIFITLPEALAGWEGSGSGYIVTKKGIFDIQAVAQSGAIKIIGLYGRNQITLKPGRSLAFELKLSHTSP